VKQWGPDLKDPTPIFALADFRGCILDQQFRLGRFIPWDQARSITKAYLESEPADARSRLDLFLVRLTVTLESLNVCGEISSEVTERSWNLRLNFFATLGCAKIRTEARGAKVCMRRVFRRPARIR